MASYSRGRFISTFLDSPIIKNERDEFYETLLMVRDGLRVTCHRAVESKAKEMLTVIGNDDIFALDPDLYPSFDSELVPENKIVEIEDSRSLGNMVFGQASDGARKWGSPSGLGVSFFSSSDLDQKTIAWYNKMRQLETVVQSIASSRALGSRGTCRVRSGNIYYHGDEYFGVIKIDSVAAWYVVSYTQLLMFKDLYYSRFNTMVAAWQIYRSTELTETIHMCLEWFFKCIAVYGNKGYEVGKSIEALSKANLIRRCDPILGCEGSYEDQLQGLIEKEKKLGKRSEFLACELDSILKRELKVPELVELFGLQKLSGHPLIDPEVGGESVKTEARKKITYSYSKVRRLRNNCCRLYLEGYIRKERQWPPLEFTPKAKRTKLYQLYSLGERKVVRSSYPIDDWEEVRFLKHHDFDYFPNFTDLMDDKSISLYRDEAAATWDKKIKTRSNQRLLLEMLSRPEVSIKAIIDRVRSGDIPYSWLIVSLYPKEREFKIAARMFSMMVFEMRAYFTATEANMAEHVFPNLPQQTMTLSKQEIQELFHKVTNLSMNEDMEKLYLEVDLTRWNLRWHPEVIDPIGQDLDDMFGLSGLYTTIHHFFAQCMILVRVPVCRPEGIELEHPPESGLLFYDHEVGFEGIGQKPWTFATYGMIDLGAGDISPIYYLIGQGDNQIILMSVDCSEVLDRTQHLRDVSKRAKMRIKEECENVGQEAKPDECLESTCVVTYSKDVYINGVEHFTSAKAHSRIFPHSSSDFPSLDGSIGSISGQCLSASERTKNPMNSFVIWCFHAALYLVRLKNSVYVESCMLRDKSREALTTRVMYGLMVLPGELGGTQIAPVTSFFYKGGADPLSKAYASLKFYQDSSPLVRKFSYALTSKQWFEKKPDLNQLLDDPYGLPLVRPSTAENSIFIASKSRVNGLAKNREIRELTSARIEQYNADLREILLSCSPLNPILLSDVLGWSVVGAQDTVSRMFTSTRTIQSLLQGDDELNVCSQILATGTGHFMNAVSRISLTTAGERTITNIFEDVENMRKHWAGSSDVNISGLTSYTPFDLQLVVSKDPPRTPGFKALYKYPGMADVHHTRGVQDPYIGRSTIEKRSEHGYKIVTSSAPERAVKRLADIATQPGVSISFRLMISEVAKSRANVSLSDVYPLIGNSVGGSIAHRYSSRLGLRSANGLGSMSFASNCILVNDDAYPISGGERDVPIMVQECMVGSIAILGMNSLHYQSDLYTLLKTDQMGWTFLPDDNMEVNNLKEHDIPFLSGNRLATSDVITLKKTHGPHSTPFITPLPDVGSFGHHPKYALRRAIGRALEGSHSALAIADQGTGVIRFKIDILEARGIGLREMIQSAAFEISLTACETLFSKSRAELRWTPAPMITTLSEAFSKCVVNIFLHPMFKEDAMVLSVLRPSSLKYSFGGQNPQRRLRDHIAREALGYFSDPGSKIFTEKEIIFLDDKESISSRLIVRRFKAILLQGIMSGQVHPKTALHMVTRNIPNALRSEPTEYGKLSAFYRLCVALSDWSKESKLVNLAEHLTSLYTGERLYLCKIPAVELLRVARTVNIVEVRDEILDRGLTPDLHETTTEGVLWTRVNGGSPFSLLGANDNVPIDEWREFQMSRLSGRIYGRESNAGYSYDTISKIAAGRICVIVGNGYGSGAAVFLKRGALLVFGLDLWEDYEESASMTGSVVPPAVSQVQQESKYIQILTSASATGDVRHTTTAHMINTHTQTGSLYIIDVPIQSSKDLESILATCSLLSGRSQVLIRIMKTKRQILEVFSVLKDCGMEPRIYTVSVHKALVEVWVEIQVSSTYTLSPVITSQESSCIFLNDDLRDLSFLGGGEEDLILTLEGPYAGLDDTSIEDGVMNLHGLLEVSIGELDHRFTYSQWTEVIHVLLMRNLRRQGLTMQLLLDLLHEDIIHVSVGNHNIPVSVGDKLRVVVSKTLSRLLPRV